MTENLSADRKRLLYRATHRGFKEADLVIGHFAASHLGEMTEEEVMEFTQLLEVPDQELYAWIIGRSEVPDNYRGSVIEKMKSFDVATIVRGRAS